MLVSSRRSFILGLVVPLTLSACAKGPEYEQVARKFMDKYYIEMSLAGAKEYTTGLAKEKLENQIKLLDGQNPGPGTDIPRVQVKLQSNEAPGPDEASLIYEVTPHAEDVGKRKVYLKLRKEGGDWKVTQWSEGEQKIN